MLTSLPHALIPKEVHIIGAPLHVTLNVECAGYSWRCTEHSKIVRICFAFSVFLSYSQATVYALSVCPCPVSHVPLLAGVYTQQLRCIAVV